MPSVEIYQITILIVSFVLTLFYIYDILSYIVQSFKQYLKFGHVEKDKFFDSLELNNYNSKFVKTIHIFIVFLLLFTGVVGFLGFVLLTLIYCSISLFSILFYIILTIYFSFLSANMIFFISVGIPSFMFSWKIIGAYHNSKIYKHIK